MSNWLVINYENMYKEKLGVSKLEKSEKKFLRDFFNIQVDFGGKTIYYHAIYRFKRGYPSFYISWKIKNDFKRSFKDLDAPDNLILMIDEFSKKMYFDTMKAYCKVTEW